MGWLNNIRNSFRNLAGKPPIEEPVVPENSVLHKARFYESDPDRLKEMLSNVDLPIDPDLASKKLHSLNLPRSTVQGETYSIPHDKGTDYTIISHDSGGESCDP